MPRDASIVQPFADGDYTFKLDWGSLRLLQEATDMGPWHLHHHLSSGSWRIEHIASVIRCALIGGGKKPDEALKLVRSYVEDRPPMENLLLAQAVLSAGIVGAPEEDLGKADAANQKSN